MHPIINKFRFVVLDNFVINEPMISIKKNTSYLTNQFLLLEYHHVSAHAFNPSDLRYCTYNIIPHTIAPIIAPNCNVSLDAININPRLVRRIIGMDWSFDIKNNITENIPKNKKEIIGNKIMYFKTNSILC